jgi:serine/threonine protein kinase
VKLIHPSALTPSAFRSEIAALSALDHPHVIRFLDRVEALGGVFLVMEMAEGVDLAEYLGEWLWLVGSALAGSGV